MARKSKCGPDRHGSSEAFQYRVSNVLRKSIISSTHDGGAKYHQKRPEKNCSVSKRASHPNVFAVRQSRPTIRKSGSVISNRSKFPKNFALKKIARKVSLGGHNADFNVLLYSPTSTNYEKLFKSSGITFMLVQTLFFNNTASGSESSLLYFCLHCQINVCAWVCESVLLGRNKMQTVRKQGIHQYLG